MNTTQNRKVIRNKIGLLKLVKQRASVSVAASRRAVSAMGKGEYS